MEPALSGITGGVEGDRPVEDAVRELQEESGYEADEDEFIYLGTCRGVKSNDTVYHLYAVDVTNKKQGRALGDGSALDNAPVEWHPNAVDCDDPQAAHAYLKLIYALNHWR
jgi:8-oxo-dGTP pyrophosphatase MutT (NUDIX family)